MFLDLIQALLALQYLKPILLFLIPKFGQKSYICNIVYIINQFINYIIRELGKQIVIDADLVKSNSSICPDNYINYIIISLFSILVAGTHTCFNRYVSSLNMVRYLVICYMFPLHANFLNNLLYF